MPRRSAALLPRARHDPRLRQRRVRVSAGPPVTELANVPSIWNPLSVGPRYATPASHLHEVFGLEASVGMVVLSRRSAPVLLEPPVRDDEQWRLDDPSHDRERHRPADYRSEEHTSELQSLR